MTLVIQLLCCAGAVAIIATLVNGDRSRPALAVSAALLATAVVALLGVQSLWPNVQKQRVAAKGQQGLTTAAANTAGGRAAGLNADFIEWAVGQTKTSDTWFLEPPEPTVMQWLSYRMLPRLALETPRKGTWLIFYNSSPAKVGLHKSQLSDVRTYQPQFSIARLEQPGGTK
jgi:hypothetical protein